MFALQSASCASDTYGVSRSPAKWHGTSAVVALKCQKRVDVRYGAVLEQCLPGDGQVSQIEIRGLLLETVLDRIAAGRQIATAGLMLINKAVHMH